MSQPIRRSESTFKATDRTQLHHRTWVGESSGRTIALVHGFGEHSGRYDAMGEWFAARGFAVHAYDLRGHGHSGGLRNHVRSFDEYVDDTLEFLRVVGTSHSESPLKLIGHSMGGLIVARALATRELSIDAAVTSSAALAISPDLSKTKQWAARVFGKLLPRVRTSSGLPADGLSRDPEVVRAYEADPLVDTAMTASLGRAMLAAQRELAGGGARITIPLLGLHGADDPICPAWGTEQFMEHVLVPGSSCKLYSGLRHEIFNEPEREQVWQDVLDFIERVGAAGSGPAAPSAAASPADTDTDSETG